MKSISGMKIREILKAKNNFSFMAIRDIAKLVSCSKTTVSEILQKQSLLEIEYSQLEQLNDLELKELFYPIINNPSNLLLPDWSFVYEAINRHGSKKNLQYMYEYLTEAKETNISYSYFCDLFRRWEKTLVKDSYLIIERKPGQKLYIDWVGDTLKCVRGDEGGNPITAYFFITTLGVSSYPFCMAFPSMKQQHWNIGHIKAIEWYGGLTERWVPDNTKTATIHCNLYNPTLNKSYAEMGRYYNIAIMPARVRTPKDKASAEEFVNDVEVWILEKIKDHGIFENFEELNDFIFKETRKIAEKKNKNTNESRFEVFERIDKPYLLKPPNIPYIPYILKVGIVPNSYHIDYEGFSYSVPYKYIKKRYELHAREKLIEIFVDNERVASHIKGMNDSKKVITINEHMPKKHQKYIQFEKMGKDSYRESAAKIGPYSAMVIEHWLTCFDFPEQGYKICSSIINLQELYEVENLELACKKAMQLGQLQATEIRDILINKLYLIKDNDSGSEPTVDHENIRGDFK
jgi:transposase